MMVRDSAALSAVRASSRLNFIKNTAASGLESGHPFRVAPLLRIDFLSPPDFWPPCLPRRRWRLRRLTAPAADTIHSLVGAALPSMNGLGPSEIWIDDAFCRAA